MSEVHHPKLKINITGFGAFHGVNDNPSKHIVSTLEKELSTNANVEYSFDILDVCVPSVDEYFNRQEKEQNYESKQNIVYLHFGVAGSNVRYELENRAFNEKTFRAPDNSMLQPFKEPIDHSFDLCSFICTNIDINMLVDRVNATLRNNGQHPPIQHFVKAYYENMELKSTKNPLLDEEHRKKVWLKLQKQRIVEEENDNFAVISEDAGRYLCNYIYYCSLSYCAKRMLTTSESKDCCRQTCFNSLFVHVPDISTIPIEYQLIFARTLVSELVSMYTEK